MEHFFYKKPGHLTKEKHKRIVVESKQKKHCN